MGQGGAARPNSHDRQDFGPLIPLARALADLMARTRPIEPRSLPIGETAGRVLAAPVQAPAAVPPQSIALRDGWAVAGENVVGASSYSPVVVAHPAWVEAGQLMPAGTDAVLPPDGVSPHGAFAEVVADAAPGEGIRRVGEDAPSGAILRPAGERMRASDIAVALGAGVGQALVRVSRLRILSLPRPGLSDAAGELVTRFAEAAGAAVERVELPSRDAGVIAAALKDDGADVIVILGDAGREDEAAEALAAYGSLIAHGVALRPGETSGCGLVGSMPVVLVPGRLEAALAATLMLVLPCLDHLMDAAPRQPMLAGPLTRKVASGVGVTEMVLVRRTAQGLEPLAVGDLTLAAIGETEAWFAIPADSEGFAAGATVPAFLL